MNRLIAAMLCGWLLIGSSASAEPPKGFWCHGDAPTYRHCHGTFVLDEDLFPAVGYDTFTGYIRVRIWSDTATLKIDCESAYLLPPVSYSPLGCSSGGVMGSWVNGQTISYDVEAVGVGGWEVDSASTS